MILEIMNPGLFHPTGPSPSLFAVLGMALFFSGTAPANAEPTLVALLDESRIPDQSFTATVEIRQTARQNAAVKVSVYRSFNLCDEEAGTGISTLLLCLQPRNDAGKRVLVLKDACWFHDPRAKRPTRLAAGQLWSQPTATDSPNWRLSRDFSASSAGQENLACGDGRTRTCTVLDFTPHAPSSPAPARMRFWVDEEGRYWKVEHFTRSGKLFRTIEVLRYENLLGSMRVASQRITSGPEVAEVTLSEVRASRLPPEWFDPDRFSGVELP